MYWIDDLAEGSEVGYVRTWGLSFCLHGPRYRRGVLGRRESVVLIALERLAVGVGWSANPFCIVLDSLAVLWLYEVMRRRMYM